MQEHDYSSALKAEFKNLLWLLWQFLELPDPTALQYDMADYIQHGPKRRILMAFRGAAKSWITAAYVIWRLLKDPNVKILVVSASQDRATAFTQFVLRLIHEVPELQHLIPRPEQRQSVVAFDVAGAKPDQAPSVRSVGIKGQMTGGRADVIVADDVETPKTAGSEIERLRLQELVKEFDAVLKPGGEVVYLGTPQIEQSLYFELEQSRGYAVRIWPARYPTEAQAPAYGDRLGPCIQQGLSTLAGRPSEPSRFPDSELDARELSYGRSGFALQFMLDPRANDRARYPLRLSDLIVMDLTDPDKGPLAVSWTEDPNYLWRDLPVTGLGGDRLRRPLRVGDEWADYAGSVMFIDPSGRGKDETGYAIVKHLAGRLFLVDAGGFRQGFDEVVLKGLAEAAKREKVNLVLIESNFGQGMFGPIFQPHIPGIRIEEVRHRGQKELRIIQALEPIMNQHRLVVNAQLIRKDWTSVDDYTDVGDKAAYYRLFHQLTRLTKERNALAHDDRLEAVAGAVAYWADKIAHQTEESENAIRKEELERMMEALEEGFIRFMSGRVPLEKADLGSEASWAKRGSHL